MNKVVDLKNLCVCKIKGITRKKIAAVSIFALVAIFSLSIIPALALDTGLDYGTFTGLSSKDVRVTIMEIVRIILGFVGIIALLIIIYAGYVWMTSAGNTERIDSAKRILRNAAIGLLIIFLAFAIVSFIINSLNGTFGSGQPGGPGGPPGYEDGNLGNGIIESVFPAPFAKNVARNTNIMVTFKVAMDPKTVMDTTLNVCTAGIPCVGLVDSDNVRIYEYGSGPGQGEGNRLEDEQVIARSIDGKTFVFDPIGNLGNSENNSWYEVKLTDGIEKTNGESAFVGVMTYYAWPFEVGTFIDIDPVEAVNFFPGPDNVRDDYSQSPGTTGSGTITVNALPSTLVQPQVDTNRAYPDPGDFTPEPGIVVNGTYNGTYNGIVGITLPAGVKDGQTANASWSPTRAGAAIEYIMSGNSIILGDGVTLTFTNPTEGSDKWEIILTSYKEADTLRVGNKSYSFVAANPVGNQIEVGSNTFEMANNIADKVNEDTQDPNITATVVNNTVSLDSTIAGAVGDFSVSATAAQGSWAGISVTAGTNPTFGSQVKGASDKPRNAVIRVDFNEAVDPTQVNDNSLVIQYHNNPDSPTDWSDGNWTDVEGSRLVSNQYRTVEFLSGSQCGVCEGGTNNGDPCSDSSSCGGGTCQAVANSCGDIVYCLPVLNDGNNVTSGYDSTLYRVRVNAGILKSCVSNADCSDGDFGLCVDTPGGSGGVCANLNPYTAAKNFFFPEVGFPANGIIDSAGNSFNGDRDTYILNNKEFGRAEGPQSQSDQPPYELNNSNYEIQGDDLILYFYINKTLDLSPPNITIIEPVVQGVGISLTAPLTAEFDELLMSSSLKSGFNYEDGYCECATADDCFDGQTCENNRCKNEGSDQLFCRENVDCKNSTECHNRKYVSLIDRATFPVGWWIASNGLDVNLPLDTYADITKVYINHTRFAEVTSYGSDFGSGIKDAYQNCYLPSEGPDYSSCDPKTGIGCCGVLPTAPYCCDGVAMTQDQWDGSDDGTPSTCFTGY